MKLLKTFVLMPLFVLSICACIHFCVQLNCGFLFKQIAAVGSSLSIFLLWGLTMEALDGRMRASQGETDEVQV